MSNQTICYFRTNSMTIFFLASPLLIHNAHSLKLIHSFLFKMENGNKAELLTLFVDIIDSTEVIYVSQQNSCFDH